MQPNATDSSQPAINSVRKSHSPYKYKKVLDGRKQPIRGLWERNGKYVARITVEDEASIKHNRWVPQAQEKLKALHVDRIRNELPVLKQTPKFAEYADQYLAYFDTVKDAKRPAPCPKSAVSLTNGKNTWVGCGSIKSGVFTSIPSFKSVRRKAFQVVRSISTSLACKMF